MGWDFGLPRYGFWSTFTLWRPRTRWRVQKIGHGSPPPPPPTRADVRAARWLQFELEQQSPVRESARPNV